MHLTWQELLLKAAQLIEEHGLNKGWFINETTGCLCVIGALNVASGSPDGLSPAIPNVISFNEACNQLEKYLSHKPGIPYADGAVVISKWNDRSTTTKEIVIDALKGAAEL